MMLPHLDKTEKKVLSVLMHRYPGWDEVSVNVEMFGRENHKEIFKRIESDVSAIDIVIFVENLMKAGLLESIGGPAEITEIYHAEVNAQLFKKNVARLREYSARRKTILNSHEAIRRAETDGENFLEVLGEPITEIFETATSTATERNKKTVIDGIMREFADMIAGKVSPMGLTVSLPTLTKAIRGFHTPRYAVLSAYPSGGKTLLAIQWLLDFVKQDCPSMFIGMEMPTDQVMKRAICTSSGISPEALYDPLSYASRENKDQPTKEHLKAIRDACRLIINSPIHFEESIAPELPELLTIIRRGVKRHGIKVVAIDYLQLIRDKSAKGNREQEISNISHALQAIGKELELFVLVLSQQNQDGGTKYATTTTEDVDYHFSIEQVMDKEADDFKKVTGLWINKDRHTNRSGFKIPIKKDDEGLFFKENSLITSI